MRSHIKKMVTTCLIAVGLTYASLIVPGRVIAVCGDLGTPIYCPVLAYGFPLPFVADSRSTSPVGSVARDPLFLFAGLDDVLWPRLGLAGAFWLLVAVIGRSMWQRWRRQRNSG